MSAARTLKIGGMQLDATLPKMTKAVRVALDAAMPTAQRVIVLTMEEAVALPENLLARFVRSGLRYRGFYTCTYGEAKERRLYVRADCLPRCLFSDCTTAITHSTQRNWLSQGKPLPLTYCCDAHVPGNGAHKLPPALASTVAAAHFYTTTRLPLTKGSAE